MTKQKTKILVPDENLEWKNSVNWANLSIDERRDLLEKEEKFDIDLFDNPPTYQLQPEEIDYEQKKLTTRIKLKIANWASHIGINHFIRRGDFSIEEIKGVENLKNIKTGAIITCNHFSPNDTFVMQKVLKKCKKKNSFRIIREGNYTNPPVLKFFMRNCGVLPLSSNMKTMKKFLRAVDNILQRGDNIVIYPEEGMWLDYRKPRPLKDGAFRFASKNNVPVVPIFITMKYGEKLTQKGNKSPIYTVHILPAIEPNTQLSLKENIEIMKQLNYDAWCNVYEQVYGEKVEYLKKPTEN